MQILILIGLYFLKCTKFDQLILRKIIKIVATRCQVLTLKCTKIDFGEGRGGQGALDLSPPRFDNPGYGPAQVAEKDSKRLLERYDSQRKYWGQTGQEKLELSVEERRMR